MKIIKTIIALAFFLALPQAYADGGTWRTTCTKNIACPAGQTGYITVSTTFSNQGGVKCHNPSIYWGNAKTTANTCVNSAPIYKETKYDYGTKSCPAAQPSGIINTKQSYDVWSDGSIRNVSGFKEISRTCTPIYVRTDYDYGTKSCPAAQPSGIINTKKSYEVWSDGSIKNVSGFKEISRTCAAIYLRTNYDYGTSYCPVTQPRGIINTKKSYEVWSDGSIKNVSGFKEISRTCTAIYLRTETEYRESSCAAGQSGKITQSRTYDRWTDGDLKNYSKWGLFKNTCSVKNEDFNREERSEMCPVGYTGKKTYKWEEYYTDDSYNTVDADGIKIEYILSTFHQREVLKSNTCKEIPTQNIETKDGVQEEACDIYLQATPGSFSGVVYKYGKYTTTYNSQSKGSNTIFNVKTIDRTSCMAQTTDMAAEYKTEDCGLGETGSKKYLRYKAINSKSEVTYPYGDWVFFENTCVKQLSVENLKPIEPEKVTGLLGNMHFTSSRLMADDSFSTYLNNLAADGWAGKERHKLTISIDDLSNGSYDAKKISSIISKFQSVVGAGNADVKIVLPRSIDKLVVNGNITAKASASKSLVLKSIRLVGTNAVVNYFELTSGKAVKAPIAKEAKIQVLSSGVNLAKIISE